MGFDWFIDTVPEVIERVEQAEVRGVTRGRLEGKVEGRQEGRQEGELQALRRTVLKAVQIRFPTLMDFARMQVEKFTAPDHLDSLALHIMLAPDEATVIHLLTEKHG